MNERWIIAALVAGWALLGSAAHAAADDGCGSGESAPVEPGTVYVEPRSCDFGPPADEYSVEPTLPDATPPGDGALPEPSAPMEPPPELPPEQPKQN